MNHKPTWAVDFDGTLCDNRWPQIGEEHNDIITLLRIAKEQGVQLILWTCRDGQELEDAIDWCADRGLIFDAINDNLPEVIDRFRCNPRKITADLYIDDRGVNPTEGLLCLINHLPTRSGNT